MKSLSRAVLNLLAAGAVSVLAVGCANVPVSPPRAVAAVMQADGAHVSWEHGSALETELIVERRVPGDHFKKLVSVAGNASDYLDASPVAGSAYRVLAFIGGQPWSGTYSNEARLQ